MTVVRTATDGWARESQPATNFGQAVRLWVNGGASGNDRQAFVHFARPFQLGSTILSAKLRVRTRGAWSGTQLLTAKRITGKWAESTLRWNNRPAVSATNAASLSVVGAADGAQIELDVTAMMQDVSSGVGFFGFRLELDTNVNRSVHSAEATVASLRPQLEVVWTVKPDVPTNLAPAGGRAVSLAKPILGWTFTDRDAAGAQTSSQVQLSTSSDFTTPEYDSGKIANTAHLWDLAPTAYAGLAADAVRFWRVRVWDDTDLVSDWSDAVSFTRKTQGSLNMSSPGATVDDLTPPVTWALTGRTQEAYQVQLYLLEAGVPILIYNSGRITSTATSVTLPATDPLAIVGEGLITSGHTYRVELRVWDNLDRQAIALDPDYTVDVQDFTYVRSGAPAAVTTLNATLPTANGPGVQLDFSRSVQPDYFALKVDGVEVVSRIEPADVFVSGTSYRFTYWNATPRVTHTYEVEAVVDSAGHLQHSDANATDTETTDPDGIWLADPDDNKAVRVAGSDSLDLAIGEAGETITLASSRAPLRITETVRGYEGSVSGYLIGKTARTDFLTLKGRLKRLRFVVSDLNIAVELGAVAAPPTPLDDDRLYSCSFELAQVDNFTFDVAGG